MIPVRPFTAIFFCENHRCEMPHEVQFLRYNPTTNTVGFMATCEECDEDAYSDKDIVGFTASLIAEDWDLITPIEDNLIFN